MTVPSPCISVCTLDERTDLCVGCLRSRAEIARWTILSEEEKRALVAVLPARRGLLEM